MLSDHKDSDSYSYSRTWEDFHAMLDKAEIKKNIHHAALMGSNSQGLSKKEKMAHARNFKALEGVIKTLRWSMGDVHIEHPLE
tara:strand:+ start:339 stop:587 length:249 start_codon:yes stop_codon:yes gene_type:complete